MNHKPTRILRRLFFLVVILLAFTVTQCQSQSNNSKVSDSSSQTATAENNVNPADEGNPFVEAAMPLNVSSSAVDLSNAISKVAREAIPAVAHIEVTQRQEITNPFLPFESDPFFHYFFDVPRHMPRKFKRELRGLGSGMIMDAQGHILTNNHVVAGANEINVVLADGQRYPAKLVGTDPKTDLAVIQIEADGELPYVTFGDSDEMEVGNWVVAIGAPQGLDQTVTQGIISAKHRRGILDPSSYQDYLQTDAAINPGNSGGPLLNLQGKVIGVNAAIVSESGGFEGIGFAIPSNMAVHIANALIEEGKVERGWLGVSIQDLTPDLRKYMKLDVAKGALIADVAKGGPADDAGLQKNDVVTAYDGKKISDASSLQNMVANTAIGREVTLTVMREGEYRDVKVKIGDLQDAYKKLAASLNDRLGAIMRPVTEKEAQRYGLTGSRGVAIASLQADGLLGRSGFEVDDIILAVNGQSISDVQDFINIIESLKPHQWVQFLVLDHRTGQTGYIRVMVG
jgi:serine protease Do